MGKYKYFDRIIECKDHFSVISILNEENVTLCSKMIEALVKGMNGWQTDYIFRPDFEEYAKAVNANHKTTNVSNMIKQLNDYNLIIYKGCGFDKMISSFDTTIPKDFAANVMEALISGGYKADFDLKDLKSIDLSGKFKILIHRLCTDDKIVTNKNGNDFIYFLKYLRELRNKYKGHDTEEAKEKTKKEEIYGVLIEIYNKLTVAINNSENDIKKPENIKKVLISYRDNVLDPLTEEYRLVNFPEYVKLSKTEPVDVEKIYSYNIFIEYSAMMSKYNQVLTQELFGKIKAGNKKIYYDKRSIDRLIETKNSHDRFLSERASHFQHDLEAVGKYAGWLETSGRTEGAYPTDYIVNMLGRLDDHWCFITADRHFASDVWAEGKDNLIALAPNDDRKTFIALDNDTVLENPNIEYNVVADDADRDVVSRDKKSSTSLIHTGKKENVVIHDVQMPDATETKPFIPVQGGKVVITDQGPTILDRETGSGGEGCIYDIGYGNKLVKIYNEESWSKEKIKKINEMVNDKGLFEDSPQICWPMDCVCNTSGRPVGFLMPKAGNDSDDRKSISLDDLLTEIRAGENSDWRRCHLTELCREVAKGFKKLHSQDIFMGDVNPSNIFINYSKDLLDIKVYFIDVDSYQYKEYNCPVGLIEYTSPRILKMHGGEEYAFIRRTKEDESFAEAVLYYYIMFLSEYPFVIDYETDIKASIQRHLFLYISDEEEKCNNYSRNIWNNLSDRLKEMFSAVFTQEKYIDDSTWIEAFTEMLARITDKKSSDMIFPENYLKDENDRFIVKRCVICNKLYETAASLQTKDHDDIEEKDNICGECRMVPLIHMRRVYRMECPVCGKPWTANEWDLLNNYLNDTDNSINPEAIDFEKNIACPDCDISFTISDNDGTDGEMSPVERKKSLQKKYKAAMNNFIKTGSDIK